MAILPYLAMTAAELANCPALPEKIAFMACHFSSYGTGLQDLPETIPEGSVLILDDRIPAAGQDPRCIVQQLQEAMERFDCSRLLLDLQKDGCEKIVEAIVKQIPDAVVSEKYARQLSCPVFLSPVPILQSVEEYIAPWAGRELWLDGAVECIAVTVTQAGSALLPCSATGEFPFSEEALHCRYRLELQEDAARFILYRSKEDVAALLDEAEKLGIANAVGLYQQLR